MDWRLNWLETEGDLGPWRDQITSEIEEARHIIARVLAPPRLDILVQRLAGVMIPEIGIVGHAHRKTLFALTLDPDNSNFATCLRDGSLRRQVVHEAHHCLRMAGPGYGRTLGEALVSEGLAGRFAGYLFGTPPELWENAVGEDVLRANLRTTRRLQRRITTMMDGSLVSGESALAGSATLWAIGSSAIGWPLHLKFPALFGSMCRRRRFSMPPGFIVGSAP